MRLGFLIVLMAIASCATPYQENGLTGGVRAAGLGGDNYRIEANLNAYSSQSMVQDYMLLRAAETARANGAVGFIIQGAQNTSTAGQFVVPGRATTSGYAYGNNGYAYGQATTTYTPAQAYTFIRPGGMMIITLVRDPVPPGLQYFRADDIVAAIGPRVQRAR